MNHADENPPTIDQRFLDLLVDDELSEPERRQFLLSLDETADGWRRCALAFLEAQSWGRELSRVSDPPRAESRGEERPGRGGVRLGKHWRTLVAMAASFLLALGLGIRGRDWFVPNTRPVSAPVEVAQSDVLAHPADPDGARENRLVVRADEARGAEEKPDTWQIVSVPVSDGSGKITMVQLPAVERDSIEDAWRMDMPRGLSPELVRTIENSGHRVRTQRRLLPLRMNDGRRLVVPVDQVELHYVGAGPYY